MHTVTIVTNTLLHDTAKILKLKNNSDKHHKKH